MSRKLETGTVIIPAGRSLIFEEPDGGKEWRLRNTAQGLVIESGESPVHFHPTPNAVVVRGDLTVAGDIGRMVGPHNFVNRWEVVTSSGTGSKGHVRIDSMPDGKFMITEEGMGTEQILVYNRWTGTLDRAPDEPGPHRCISFWDRKMTGGSTDRIFAMRTKKDDADVLFSWEEDGDDSSNGHGTWGAEPGG